MLLFTKYLRSALIFAVLIVSCSYKSSKLFSNAKEIEATSEWTLLEEGDTIPAGLHIKMDLSTGEKWVKLRDEIDGDKEKEKISVVGEEGYFSAELKADGQVALVRDEDGKVLNEDESTNSKNVAPEYDFMMMHRTLSKLGPEEAARMGLPDLPPDNAPLEIQQHFENIMEEIWTTRQKALAELEVADLPKILKKHIYSIMSYIQDGVISDPGLIDDEFEVGEEGEVGDILFVLEDLEYQLNDLDNARDFHTLEGWPILVSLLSETAHSQALKQISYSFSNETNVEASKIFDAQLSYKQNVQATAAWAIGSAVKNIHEFLPWALEDISKLEYISVPKAHVEASSPQVITVLDLLVHQLQNTFYLESGEALSLQNTKPALKLQQKLIYALGSLIRLNPAAQQYFISIKGPQTLSAILKSIINQSNPSQKSLNLASKIINLGSDILTELNEIADNDDYRLRVTTAFSGPFWCDSSPLLFSIYSQTSNVKAQETILDTMNGMVSVCKAIWSDNVRLSVHSMIDEWGRMTMDEEWRDEIVKKGEAFLSSLEE